MRRMSQSEGFKYWQWLLIVLAVLLGAATAWGIYKRLKRPKPSAALKKQPVNTEQQAISEQPASQKHHSANTIIENPHQQFIDKATAAVKKHLSDYDFDVPQLANELSVSRTTLHRRMKEATGQTTTAFIRNIRLQTACQILLFSPGIRVSDLAYQVGFNDPKYFSRCFKDAYGVLPGDYTTENYVAK